MLAELACGYPDRLFRAIGHPVSWIGALIAALDRRSTTRRPAEGRRKAAGVLALVVVVAGELGGRRGGRVAGGGRARRGSSWSWSRSTLLAQRSLAGPCGGGGAGRWRRAACRRGARRWGGSSGATWRASTRAAVARAAVESLAENFADGVVAPVFWMAVLGLPGAAAYKAINTADSMIGHRTRAASRLRLGGGAARRSRQPAGVAAGGAAPDRARPASCRGRRRAGRWRRCAGMRAGTARRTPAGRRRRWRGRSASRWPGRGAMAGCWSRTR